MDYVIYSGHIPLIDMNCYKFFCLTTRLQHQSPRETSLQSKSVINTDVKKRYKSWYLLATSWSEDFERLGDRPRKLVLLNTSILTSLLRFTQASSPSYFNHAALYLDKEESLACQITSPLNKKIGSFVKQSL